MVSGINHITISVSDLENSLGFYVDLLGMVPIVSWDSGAYLKSGSLWFCLSCGEVFHAKDYSHIAFSVGDRELKELREKFREYGVEEWQSNKSEGDSLYVFDPDGHKLELHIGSLESRLEALRSKPYSGLKWY